MTNTCVNCDKSLSVYVVDPDEDYELACGEGQIPHLIVVTMTQAGGHFLNVEPLGYCSQECMESEKGINAITEAFDKNDLSIEYYEKEEICSLYAYHVDDDNCNLRDLGFESYATVTRMLNLFGLEIVPKKRGVLSFLGL